VTNAARNKTQKVPKQTLNNLTNQNMIDEAVRKFAIIFVELLLKSGIVPDEQKEILKEISNTAVMSLGLPLSNNSIAGDNGMEIITEEKRVVASAEGTKILSKRTLKDVVSLETPAKKSKAKEKKMSLLTPQATQNCVCVENAVLVKRCKALDHTKLNALA